MAGLMRDAIAVRSGQLRVQVAIQTATPTRIASGDTTKVWATDETVWASIRPLSGRMLLLAQQVKSTANREVIILYYSGLTVSQRLLTTEGSRELYIEYIDNYDERNIMMRLLCKEDA